MFLKKNLEYIKQFFFKCKSRSFFSNLKLFVYSVFYLLFFFLKPLGLAVWFFVPKHVRRSLFRKQYRLITRWLNLPEKKKEVFFFLFIVGTLFFSLSFIQIFIIKVKFLFLLGVLIYFGGGLLVMFLYLCVLLFPTFSILDYPILVWFVDWYVSNFCIYAGKISGPVWDIFFWYLRVIHTPVSYFMKRDTSYERHFFVSLFSICFVGFLFYKIPSFISEGLDPLFFSFGTFSTFRKPKGSILKTVLFLFFFFFFFVFFKTPYN